MSIKKSIVTGFIWSSGGQVLIVLTGLVANIILARYLSPTEFGLMGIIMFFINLSDVLARGGLAGALLRQKEAKPIEYSTVFLFNFVVSVLCYCCLVFFSGNIAKFYNAPELDKLIDIAGIILIINAFQLINITKLTSSLKFRKRTLYQLFATMTGSIVGIVMGYLGYGVWALVSIPLFTSVTLTIVLCYREGFHGGFRFSMESFKKLFGFGINTTLANLLNTGFNNIYSLVIGKYFSVSQAGFFFQAKRLQDVPNKVLDTFAQTVLFPALAKLQDNLPLYHQVYSRIITAFTVLVGLSTILIFLFSKPIILLLFGMKWLGAVFYLQLLVIASFFYMQEQFNRVIFKVFNQTRKILLLEILKKVFQTITILVGVSYQDLDLLLYGYIISNIVSSFINYYYSRSITKSMSWGEIIMIVKIVAIGIALTALCVWLFNHLHIGDFEKLYFSPIVILVYVFALKIFKLFDLKENIKLFRGAL